MRSIVAIVLLTACFYGGWQLRDVSAQSEQAQIQADRAQQLAAAQQQARQREQVLQQQMEVLQHETQQQLAEISALERTAADNRVRELSAKYAAGSNRSHSPAPSDCQTERQRAAVLAELLAELDQLATVFATEADRNRTNLYKILHNNGMFKPVIFLGSSLADLRDFPASARQEAGWMLDDVQHGLEPTDFKPMQSIGAGVYELRIRDTSGTFRVLYVSKLENAIYVLHAFQKKTPKTAKADIVLATRRYKDLLQELSQ